MGALTLQPCLEPSTPHLSVQRAAWYSGKGSPPQSCWFSHGGRGPTSSLCFCVPGTTFIILHPSASGEEVLPGGMGARGLGSRRSASHQRTCAQDGVGGHRCSLGVLAASGVPDTSSATHPPAGSPKQVLLRGLPRTSSPPHACSLPRYLFATLHRKLA